MSFKTTLRTGMALALLLAWAPAWAHATLQSASPPVGGAVQGAPEQIRLNFSEGVVPRFSSVTVTSDGGQTLPTGALRAEGASLIAPLGQKLTPGRYRVEWKATSVDTHQTQGSFSFEVRP